MFSFASMFIRVSSLLVLGSPLDRFGLRYLTTSVLTFVVVSSSQAIACSCHGFCNPHKMPLHEIRRIFAPHSVFGYSYLMAKSTSSHRTNKNTCQFLAASSRCMMPFLTTGYFHAPPKAQLRQLRAFHISAQTPLIPRFRHSFHFLVFTEIPCDEFGGSCLSAYAQFFLFKGVLSFE
jgi:hypothetical protein